MVEIKETLRLWLGGVPKARIAVELGLDRKTVRRYITAAAKHGLADEAELTDEYTLDTLDAQGLVRWLGAKMHD